MREDLIERLRVIAQWLDQRAHFESEPETKASHAEDADTCREAAAALEAARENVERYRWLRELPEDAKETDWLWSYQGDDLDAAIDQARGKGVAE